MEDPLLQNAIESARLGFYDDARGLLLQIIRRDPNNALAWLWLAQTLDDPKRQSDCLQQALRVEPNNPDALAGVEALRSGMPLPEPGGGVVVEPEFPDLGDVFGWGTVLTEEPEAEPEPAPEAESPAPADTFNWGDLYTEEPEVAPEAESPVPADTFNWGDLYTEEPAAASEAQVEPPVADDDMFGWGELFTGEVEPEPAPPVVEEPASVVTPPKPVVIPTPIMPFIGLEEEEPEPEPEPAVPESALEPEESFLQRARRLRSHGFTPSTPQQAATSLSVPVMPAGEIPSEAGAVSSDLETGAAEAPRAAPRRKFRIFDGRVLFSILGLILLPVLIGLLAWYFFLRAPSSVGPDSLSLPVTRALSRPALGACRALKLDEFTLVETLGGELAVDTVFTGTQVAITETLIVPEGVRLFIYPEATLVFTREASLDVYGTLYVCGNDDAPVTFTAFDKMPGGWEGIRLHNSADATVLSHAVIEYAGERALYLADSVPVLSDLTIAHAALFPVSIDGSVVPDLSNNVILADNPVSGVEVLPGTLHASNAMWPNINVPYVVSGLLRVEEGATLDIQSGAIVKFWHMPRGHLPGIWVHGLLQAEGVIFTSLHDSAEDAGGATYRESIDPQPGDWGGLTFFESSEKSYLRDVILRYGGYGKAVVVMQGGSPELTDVTITDAAGYPLSADANAFPVLNNLTLDRNGGGNVLELFGDMTITGPGTRVWERLGGETPIVRVVRDTIVVAPQAKLTIHPGVIVKFAEQGRLVVQGALSAVGNNNPEEYIIFTSLYDDEYGGDTGGALVSRDRRVWGGIILEHAEVASEFHYVQIRYATMTLQDTSPVLYSSQIALAPGPGLRMTPGSSPDLRATTFQNNAVQGVAIVTGTLDSEQRWALLGESEEAQIPRILEGEVVVGADSFLTIDAGTIIKAGAAGKLTVHGHLYAAGLADQEVVFTSLHDDTLGGDTDGALLSAAAGDWKGIEIAPGGFVRFASVGIYYAEIGLMALGEQLPVVETGRVHVAYSKQPLTCAARVQIPATFVFENNEVQVTRCPTR